MSESEKKLTRIPFSSEMEEKIVNLHLWMKIIAIVFYIGTLGGFTFAVIMYQNITESFMTSNPFEVPLFGGYMIRMIIGGVIASILGMFLWKSAVKFNLVATTDTADQEYLENALMSLRSYFMVMGICLIGLVGLLIYGFYTFYQMMTVG